MAGMRTNGINIRGMMNSKFEMNMMLAIHLPFSEYLYESGSIRSPFKQFSSKLKVYMDILVCIIDKLFELINKIIYFPICTCSSSISFTNYGLFRMINKL